MCVCVVRCVLVCVGVCRCVYVCMCVYVCASASKTGAPETSRLDSLLRKIFEHDRRVNPFCIIDLAYPDGVVCCDPSLSSIELCLENVGDGPPGSVSYK